MNQYTINSERLYRKIAQCPSHLIKPAIRCNRHGTYSCGCDPKCTLDLFHPRSTGAQLVFEPFGDVRQPVPRSLGVGRSDSEQQPLSGVVPYSHARIGTVQLSSDTLKMITQSLIFKVQPVFPTTVKPIPNYQCNHKSY